jgi:hypothetical protein
LVQEWFFRYGVPKRIHSDQGRNFESELVRELCKMYGIRKSRSTPHHPLGNGQCERFNRTLHNLLKTLEEEKKRKWPDHLSEVVHIYNATPHSSTNMSPFYLMFGLEARLPIDNLLEGAIDTRPAKDWLAGHAQKMRDAQRMASANLEKHAEQRQRTYNRTACESPLKVGTVVFKRHRVLGRNKIQDHWSPIPYKVVESPGHNVYVVQPVDGVGRLDRLTRTELLDSKDSDSDCTLVGYKLEGEDERQEECRQVGSPSGTKDYQIQPGSDIEESSGEDEQTRDYEEQGDSSVREVSNGGVVVQSDLVEESEQCPQETEVQASSKENCSMSDNASSNACDGLPKENGQDMQERGDEHIDGSNKIVVPRRSGRSTAGKHSNPYHLPRSAVLNRHWVDIGEY